MFYAETVPWFRAFSELPAIVAALAGAVELSIAMAPVMHAMNAKPPRPPSIAATAPELNGGDCFLHWLEHESRSSVLPSSHYSAPTTSPSPHV